MRIKLSDPQRFWWSDIPLPESTQLVLRDLLLGRTVKIEIDPDLQAKIGEALTAALLDVFDPKHKLPTPRQLRFADQIATALGITIPAKVRESTPDQLVHQRLRCPLLASPLSKRSAGGMGRRRRMAQR